jgi:hypothetical protein
MVYSTVPVRIDCTGKVMPVDEDDSLSYGSSDRTVSTVAGQRYVENWNSGELFRHPDAGFIPAHLVEPRDLINVPKPTVGLPALKDLYPEEDTSGNQEKAVRGMACHSSCMSTFSKLPLWGRVNTRARVEMLHHQLKKPFRAGKKIVKCTGAMECFKEKDMENVQNSSGEVTEDDASSNDDFSRIVNRSRLFSSREGGLEAKPDEQNVKISGMEDKVGSVEGYGAVDRRWRYSCNLWPVDNDESKDPPGHYSHTEQAVKLHFYKDFSKQIRLKEEASIDSTPVAVPTTSLAEIYSPSYLEDDIDESVLGKKQFMTRNPSFDTSDDGSVFVLEDGLD